MANGTDTQDKTFAKSAGGRGPSYPALTLEEAMAKAAQFWSAEKRGAAPIAAAAGHWGYSPTSSSGKTVIAALIHFGLLEDQGAKDARTVRLTGRALDIVLDAPDSPKRLRAIREAAWGPKLYADILSKWSASELPSDQTLRFYLLREKSFNESGVDGFIRDFRASVSFAGLDKPDLGSPAAKVDAAPSASEDDLKKDPLPPEVGDIIQWEASGVLRLETPRRVRAKAEHEGSWWVFVDGSETGIPMEEAVIVERQAPEPSAHKQPPILPLAVAAAPVAPASMIGAEEQEVASGKFGKSMSYRLLASGGDIGAKELGKIIRLLEAYKLALGDDDE